MEVLHLSATVLEMCRQIKKYLLILLMSNTAFICVTAMKTQDLIPLLSPTLIKKYMQATKISFKHNRISLSLNNIVLISHPAAWMNLPRQLYSILWFNIIINFNNVPGNKTEMKNLKVLRAR